MMPFLGRRTRLAVSIVLTVHHDRKLKEADSLCATTLLSYSSSHMAASATTSREGQTRLPVTHAASQTRSSRSK